MKWLKLPEERVNPITTWILIAFAYTYSVGFRIFLANYKSIEALKTEGQFINTPDGYYFAKGALDALTIGKESVMGSTYGSLISQATAFFAKILPFSFETVVFFMPAFIGSLIVIPLVWIGYSIRQTYFGFLAALLGSTAYSYYIRTQAGYFDTDMLTVVMPTFIAATIIAAVISKKRYLWPFLTFLIVFYQTWYPQAYAIDSTFAFGIIGYTIVFDRKNLFNYQTAFFALLGIVGFPVAVLYPFIFKILLAICLWVIFQYREQLAHKIFWILFGALIVYYVSLSGLGPIRGLLNLYVFRSTDINSTTTASLQFFNVINTVQEAGDIPFSMFATRISGHPLTFYLSCLGLILSLFAYRSLLFLLPMAALGSLALSSGLRFTIYAVPVFAIGLAYLILFLTQKIKPLYLKLATSLILMGIALYVNWVALNPIKFNATMNSNEITALKQLATLTKPTDYIISWWDYGHPLRYYLTAFLPIDGGGHEGSDNFPVAYALTSDSQIASANMLRVSMENHKLRFKEGKDKVPGYLENYMQTHNTQNPDDFLTAIDDASFSPPQKTTDIYLVLPYQMLLITSTIDLFSNLDLLTGKRKHASFFYTTDNWQNEQAQIRFDNGILIEKTKGIVVLGKQQVRLANIYVTGYQNNKLQVKKTAVYPNGKLNLFIMQDYHRVILADNKLSNSTFLKLFVLEEYDPRYFEPVVISPVMKTYKLKI